LGTGVASPPLQFVALFGSRGTGNVGWDFSLPVRYDFKVSGALAGGPPFKDNTKPPRLSRPGKKS